MPRVRRSNPLALAVLVCLYEKPMHPYEVAHTLRTRAKHESVRLNYGSLYAVVESLDKRGLVSAVQTVRHGQRPPRTIYEITPTGTEEMHDWLSELVMTPAKEYLQFEAALSFLPALPVEDALELLRQRAEALEMQRPFLDVGAPFLPRLFRLEGEYRRSLLEAELTFVRGLISEIESGTLDGIELWQSFHQLPRGEAWKPETGPPPVP